MAISKMVIWKMGFSSAASVAGKFCRVLRPHHVKFAQPSMLRALHIKCDFFTGTDFSVLSRLQELTLDSAAFSLEGLKSLSLLQNVRLNLNCAGEFIDERLRILQSLTCLQDLDFHGTCTDATLPFLTCLSNLVRLRIMSGSRLTTAGVQLLLQLPKLKALSIPGWVGGEREKLQIPLEVKFASGFELTYVSSTNAPIVHWG